MNKNIKEKAKEFAKIAHNGQIRKSEPNKPMIIHPISVGEILESYGYDDNVIAAGYLHDVVEDTKYTLNNIKVEFGEDIAFLVQTASEPNKSLSWEERKQHTINEAIKLPFRNKLIICADKINNIESLTEVLTIKGMKVFSLFKRGYESQLWYFEKIYQSLIYGENETILIFERLKKAIDRLKKEIKYQQYLESEIFLENKDIYTKLRDLHEKKYRLLEMKENIILSKPIIIEFSGSPRTGKTTIINNLLDFFKKGGFNVKLIKEFTTSSYYKEKISPTLKTKEMYEIHKIIIEEIIKQLDNELCNSKTDIILHDRGLFDRCIWIQREFNLKTINNENYSDFIEFYLDKAQKYIDMLVLNYADEKEVLKRDYTNHLSLEQRHFLNEENVKQFNSAMFECKPIFEDVKSKILLTNTNNITINDALINIADFILNGTSDIYVKRTKKLHR